jgi:regulator of nucleoside diphosphate kinase
MHSGSILVTEPDMLKLAQRLDSQRRWPALEEDLRGGLGPVLASARVVRDDDVPRDVITLNSTVRAKDVEVGTDHTHTLVMPVHASEERGAVSVLSPLGVALLGRREGDEIEYRVPGSRTRRLTVQSVLYQPEPASFQRETVPFRP